MRVLRENAVAMEPGEVHKLALLATDDKGFAEDLWTKIVHYKMARKDMTE